MNRQNAKYKTRSEAQQEEDALHIGIGFYLQNGGSLRISGD